MKNLSLSNKVFPWYAGISRDLLFFWTIGTLFLAFVKGLEAYQIVFMFTFANIICVILQLPILKLIKKIGNTKSIRFGTFLMMIAAIFLTFGPNFYILIFGMTLYQLSAVFRNMENIAIKNNLKAVGREDEFIKVYSLTNTIYATATTIIAFVAGFLFNLNNYLPMYFMIAFTVLGFILSWFIFDINERKPNEQKVNNKISIKVTPIIILIFIVYGLVFGLISGGYTNGKLLIQFEMDSVLQTSLVASYLAFIVAVSRIARVISNVTFNKIYNKLKDRVIILLSICLVVAFIFFIVGYFLNLDIYYRITLMALGFLILLAIRDPMKTYIHDLTLNNTRPEDHQNIFTYLALVRKIGVSILGVIATMILTQYNLIWVIVMLLIFAVIQLIFIFKLYNQIPKGDYLK